MIIGVLYQNGGTQQRLMFLRFIVNVLNYIYVLHA